MENTAQAAAHAGLAPHDTLTAIRRDFPHFRIWREITGDRTRYIARRQQPVPGPHTVVTPDMGELRSALASGTGHEHDGPASPPEVPAPNIAGPPPGGRLENGRWLGTGTGAAIFAHLAWAGTLSQGRTEKIMDEFDGTY